MAYFVLLSIFQRNIPPSETSPVLGKIRCCPQIVVAAIETQKTSQFFGNYSVAKKNKLLMARECITSTTGEE